MGTGKFVNPAMSDAGKFRFKKEVHNGEANEKKRKHIEAFREVVEEPPSKRRPETPAVVKEMACLGHIFSPEYRAKEVLSLKQPVHD